VAARLVALAAVTLAATGCGGRTYSTAAAARAAAGQAVPRPLNDQPFATWDAVTELRIDVPVPGDVWRGAGVVLYRFGTPDEAAAFTDALAESADAAGSSVDIVRRDNLVLIGRRAAVTAALRRLR
jgi:hypothetical protein